MALLLCGSSRSTALLWKPCVCSNRPQCDRGKENKFPEVIITSMEIERSVLVLDFSFNTHAFSLFGGTEPCIYWQTCLVDGDLLCVPCWTGRPLAGPDLSWGSPFVTGTVALGPVGAEGHTHFLLCLFEWTLSKSNSPRINKEFIVVIIWKQKGFLELC